MSLSERLVALLVSADPDVRAIVYRGVEFFYGVGFAQSLRGAIDHQQRAGSALETGGSDEEDA